MLASYEHDPRAHHIDRRYLPSREEIIALLRLLLQLFYPGYFGRQDLTHESIRYQTGVILELLREKLECQLELSLRHGGELESQANPSVATQGLDECATHAKLLTARFLERLPELRRALIADVQAAYEGDPAACNLDEVILAYPSVLAVTVYRVAHEFYRMGVPLLPRIMTEWAHAQTGADIHPGAQIGDSFFIDHATGAVVGETTVIGAHVKLYQGVTLGARSLPRDERGRIIRGSKRHPTVEDRVTVYANATVLGGETTLGEGSVIGGSTFVTESVPAHAHVALKAPELRVVQAPPERTPP
jgi:serine O-acetyltransferase